MWRECIGRKYAQYYIAWSDLEKKLNNIEKALKIINYVRNNLYFVKSSSKIIFKILYNYRVFKIRHNQKIS